MMWIGLTGPMGSGKSTVADQLRHMGFVVLDADQIAHRALSPGSAGETKVFQTFGESIKGADGNLDRRALGRLVFGEPSLLAKLEAIVHPLVQAEVEREKKALKASGHAAAFYDVPLLFEKNMQPRFDHVLVVSAQKALRYARLKIRSQLSDAEIEERTRHHVAPEVKEAQAFAVIRNNGSLDDLRAEILRALTNLGLSPK